MSGVDDPINFITAEDFYSGAAKWNTPKTITKVHDRAPANIKFKEYWHGVTLEFNDNTLCVVQFIRPTLWRIRYDPAVILLDEYTDNNSYDLPLVKFNTKSSVRYGLC